MAGRRGTSKTQGKGKDGELTPHAWQFPISKFPADFDFFSEALKVVRSASPSAADVRAAISLLEEMIGRRLLASGFALDRMEGVREPIQAAAFSIFAWLLSDPSIMTADDDRIKAEISHVLANGDRLHAAWDFLKKSPGSNLGAKSLSAQEYSLVDHSNMDNLDFDRLYHDTAILLQERLCDLGLSEELSVHVARKIMDDFKASRSTTRHTFRTIGEATIALDFAVSVLRGFSFPVGEALQRAATEAFGDAAQFALPEKAPAIWKNRSDRLSGETPIEFLDRIWGSYIRAGICYQDTIGKLGDPMLIPIVRAYCRQHNIDPSTVLPPPRKVRTDRALAKATPGSLEAKILQRRIRERTPR